MAQGLRILALVLFLVAAILAGIGARSRESTVRYTDWWGVLVALGLACWVLSEVKGVLQ